MSDMRRRLAVVLEENGIGDPEASLHGWRCSYPERYGKCDCLSELLDELVAAVRRDEGDKGTGNERCVTEREQ